MSIWYKMSARVKHAMKGPPNICDDMAPDTHKTCHIFFQKQPELLPDELKERFSMMCPSDPMSIALLQSAGIHVNHQKQLTPVTAHPLSSSNKWEHINDLLHTDFQNIPDFQIHTVHLRNEIKGIFLLNLNQLKLW